MNPNRDHRPPGRPRDRAATARILAAALDLVIRHGYEPVTTQMIARTAGVGKQTLYRRWTGKADLVLEALLARARSEVDKPSAGAGGKTDLETFLEQTVKALKTTAPVLRSLMALAQGDEELRRRFRENFIEPRRRVLTRVLETMGVTGAREQDATTAVMFIYGSMWYRLLLDEPLDSAWAGRTANFVRRALDTDR
ncbi:MAG: TetR/AcrR family transcriptional regulator [Thermodesulfobacteriota bacterium]